MIKGNMEIVEDYFPTNEDSSQKQSQYLKNTCQREKWKLQSNFQIIIFGTMRNNSLINTFDLNVVHDFEVGPFKSR